MTEPRLFIHRLALALGRTVEDLLSTLSPQELKGWLLYDRQAGLPDIAAQWQRAASISARYKSGCVRSFGYRRGIRTISADWETWQKSILTCA